MKKILLSGALILLAGCVTLPDYSEVAPNVRKVTYQEEGKVVSEHYEMKDMETNAWYKAQKVNDAWVLTPEGKLKQQAAVSGGSDGGGGGGGGGSC